MMIKTAAEYREWASGVKANLKALGASIPDKQKESIVYAAASKLNVSATTIKNYLDGIGTNVETALEVKETVEGVISENGLID